MRRSLGGRGLCAVGSRHQRDSKKISTRNLGIAEDLNAEMPGRQRSLCSRVQTSKRFQENKYQELGYGRGPYCGEAWQTEIPVR